jgi:hypothetical protein
LYSRQALSFSGTQIGENRQFVTGDHLAELGVVERKPFQAALEVMRAGYWGPTAQIAIAALYLETWFGLKSYQAGSARGLDHLPAAKAEHTVFN